MWGKRAPRCEVQKSVHLPNVAYMPHRLDANSKTMLLEFCQLLCRSHKKCVEQLRPADCGAPSVHSEPLSLWAPCPHLVLNLQVKAELQDSRRHHCRTSPLPHRLLSLSEQMDAVQKGDWLGVLRQCLLALRCPPCSRAPTPSPAVRRLAARRRPAQTQVGRRPLLCIGASLTGSPNQHWKPTRATPRCAPGEIRQTVPPGMCGLPCDWLPIRTLQALHNFCADCKRRGALLPQALPGSPQPHAAHAALLLPQAAGRPFDSHHGGLRAP
mmetsp:Transcript_6957/g.13313  ORF Transcript_6957/g.13313 Transcript_6957/m.13313 type:complete len:269 (+) Transcript_6957:619-1425(+)